MYAQSTLDSDFALLESIRRHLLDDSETLASFPEIFSGIAPVHGGLYNGVNVGWIPSQVAESSDMVSRPPLSLHPQQQKIHGVNKNKMSL
ncbi:hypothetical protein L1049_018614 [Liquidambar formosana]|uniref:Uncharacterized protein n=1 Tax=Liquidambar formosana TaxID=63359 RepID=A0AAP0WMH3_LIQFO